MRPILSSYRLQLHAGFRLEAATALVPYLRRLGVTHLHLSPLLAARSGSMHGYDVTDPTTLNPVLGSEADLAALSDAAHASDLGLLLDIVPNHMAASTENAFWEDVLTHGAASRYARWFDIEWRAADPAPPTRILLPVLGDLRAHAIARGELSLGVEAGRVRVRYFEHSWPVDPTTLSPLLDRAAEEWERTARPGSEAFREEARQLRRLARRRAREPSAREEVRDRAASSAERIAALAAADPAAGRALERAAEAFIAGADGARRLRRLLDAQAYRLVFWRRAARELNYRRFFDVNELVALHMEDPEVFGLTHARVLAWHEAGWIDGFRIDHPDGLLDPLAYLRHLADEAFDWRPDGRYPLYVEKILARDETLRPNWPVAGTTGYDFLNEVERLFVDPPGLAEIRDDYRRLLRRAVRCSDAERDGKRRALQTGLSPGVRHLALRLLRLRRPADPMVEPAAARRALIEVIAALGVYRTYIDRHTPQGTSEDRERIETALASARQGGRAAGDALDLVGRALLAPAEGDPEREQLRLRFAQRFQQLSGPAMAKGVEDTAFYACIPLVSLNEVGGSVEGAGPDAVSAFHAANQHRATQWPAAMLAVTTHDTKRTADVRARLDALSEIPAEWEEHVYRWRKWNRELQRRTRDGSAPDANTLYLFFQVLVGIWPVGQQVDAACRDALLARLQEYMLKAVREAKQRTSWLEPDTEFEAALAAYLEAALDPARSARFLIDVAEFAARVGRAGIWNGLARETLRLAAPGVPDIYQGDELWNLALVDPDNRRPVDFALRDKTLTDLLARGGDATLRATLIDQLLDAPTDGRIKMHVVSRALAARRTEPALFVGGDYIPLEVTGSRAAQVVAFARHAAGAVAVVVAARLTGVSDVLPTGRGFWADTTVLLPELAVGTTLACVFDDHIARPLGARLPVSEALARLPVAILLGGATATSPRSARE